MISDLVERIRLVRSTGIGPVTYRQLRSRFGTAAAALEVVPDLARRGGGRAPPVGRADAEKEIARVEKFGARYLALGQGLYPRLLGELDDAPPLLVAKGDLTLLDKPLMAIVGARNASAAACRFARWRAVPSESSPVGSTSSILLKMRCGRRRCSSAASWSRKCRQGPSRERGTFLIATGSSPD